MKSNFEQMKEYFENLNPNEILDIYDRCPFIDMDWVSSDKLDKKVLKNLISDYLKTFNPEYESENIKGFRVILNNGRLILQAVGVDDKTKLNITDELTDKDNQSKAQIPTITLEQLANDIAQEKMDILKIDDKEIGRKLSEKALAGLDDLLGNTLKYYKYLALRKNNNLIIEQRSDAKGKSTHGPTPPTPPRKSDIIEFMDRAEILSDLSPSHIIVIKEKLASGEIVDDSYTAFIYRDTLEEIGQKQDGYLFVCEPIRGDRATRVMHLSEEQFKDFPLEENLGRVESVIKTYLDMSQSEFDSTKGTLTLRHRSIENFRQKMNFYVKGTDPKERPGLYLKYLKELYDNQELSLPYHKTITKKDIGKIAEEVPSSKVDRTAQQAVKTNEKIPEVK